MVYDCLVLSLSTPLKFKTSQNFSLVIRVPTQAGGYSFHLCSLGRKVQCPKGARAGSPSIHASLSQKLSAGPLRSGGKRRPRPRQGLGKIGPDSAQPLSSPLLSSPGKFSGLTAPVSSKLSFLRKFTAGLSSPFLKVAPWPGSLLPRPPPLSGLRPGSATLRCVNGAASPASHLRMEAELQMRALPVL